MGGVEIVGLPPYFKPDKKEYRVEQTTVDTKEIRGLNLRIMITIVLATISIVSTIKTDNMINRILIFLNLQLQWSLYLNPVISSYL